MSRGDTYFNPRSPRGGATCSCRLLALTVIGISIHAPHEGERPARSSMLHAVSWYFNPRSPRGGATWRVMGITGYTLSYFNPRSPRGGATSTMTRAKGGAGISIHAPHEGERLIQEGRTDGLLQISIHAPHEGERRRRGLTARSSAHFNPRSPRGGATPSISPLMSRSQYFNPRSPRGGATFAPFSVKPLLLEFQSTLPTRGSDGRPRVGQKHRPSISIHAPHEGERR